MNGCLSLLSARVLCATRTLRKHAACTHPAHAATPHSTPLSRTHTHTHARARAHLLQHRARRDARRAREHVVRRRADVGRVRQPRREAAQQRVVVERGCWGRCVLCCGVAVCRWSCALMVVLRGVCVAVCSMEADERGGAELCRLERRGPTFCLLFSLRILPPSPFSLLPLPSSPPSCSSPGAASSRMSRHSNAALRRSRPSSI